MPGMSAVPFPTYNVPSRAAAHKTAALLQATPPLGDREYSCPGFPRILGRIIGIRENSMVSPDFLGVESLGT